MVCDCRIAELKHHVGERVRLEGWLVRLRQGGGVAFLQVRDGSGVCQCVLESNKEEAFEAASGLTQESALAVTGDVRADERAPGGYEIAVSALDVVHVAQEYPITPKSHGVEFLMSHRHLWLRSQRQATLLKIRHTIIQSCRAFFDERGFVLIDTPVLVPGAGEDTQTLFPVNYFDRDVYLAQTGQLYLESACMALGKVYCLGPTFRAEKSKTRRHLTEFWMLEPEIAYADLDDVVQLAEDMICRIVGDVVRRHEDDLRSLGRDPDALRLVQAPFARITYSEAVEILHSDETQEKLAMELAEARDQLTLLEAEQKQKAGELEQTSKPWKREKITNRLHEISDEQEELKRQIRNIPQHMELARQFEWGKDLGGSDETIISRHFEGPVFVTDYPIEAKAFYMKRSDDDPRCVRNVDLLAPQGYGEVIGGSQREDNLDVLVEQMRAKGLDPNDYDWYLDLRRYGSVPHGGFGLGVERALTWICGLKHVREAIPFPRTMGRIEP
ncbi:MAG: asparagine--tRNA ligase [Kiritimatiellae bacterium]|nr:asparagine--tRNA ligase [Kiritimatiellia bacterium]